MLCLSVRFSFFHIYKCFIASFLLVATEGHWCVLAYLIFPTPKLTPAHFKAIRRCIQKFPDWIHNEINNNNKYSLRSNTKGYGGETHKTDSQNFDTAASSGRKLYHLQFSLQAASPETYGYSLIHHIGLKTVTTILFPSIWNLTD
jgi:hypothetical protein